MRKIPMRKCVATQEQLPKKELIRIVRTPQMEVKIDESGRMNGRGAYLKRTVPNPSRRSSGHARQSRFEGSHRQKRAELLRVLLAHRGEPGGVCLSSICEELASVEEKAGRRPISASEVEALLGELSREGFCQPGDGAWHV